MCSFVGSFTFGLPDDVLLSFHDENSVSRCAVAHSPPLSFLLLNGLPALRNFCSLYSFNRSRTVLKSSRMMVSVKHLKINAYFQNGLMPSGRPTLRTGVTESMSTMIKLIDRHMESNRTPNRGETRISSTKPK